MKKILFMAVSAVLLAAGCQKTEIINRIGDTMTFSTEMGKLTKVVGTADAAATDKMQNLNAQDFRVWVYNDYTDLSTTTAGNIYDGMTNLHVESYKEGENVKWKTDKAYYWPGDKKGLRFFAVSGIGNKTDAQIGTTSIIHTLATDSKSITNSTLTITDYTVNSESPNTDLMVADFVRQTQNDKTDKAVSLMFRHALSKVQFLFKTTGDIPVYVQSLKVEGINTKSTLTVTDVAPAQTVDDTAGEGDNEESTTSTTDVTQIKTYLDWGDRSVPVPFNADYDYTLTENKPDNYVDLSTLLDENNTQLVFDRFIEEESTIEPAEETEGSEGTTPTIPEFDNTAMKLTEKERVFATWLVLPQDIKTTDVALTVEIRYVIGVREFKSIFPLYTESLTSWDKNQYIKYTVNLTPNLITFTPDVEDWTEETVPEMNN